MKFNQLVKRFSKVGATIEYRMGCDGMGYYVDGNFITRSRESIEETLYQLDGDKLVQVWGTIKEQLF
jgi:hypothetical protein